MDSSPKVIWVVKGYTWGAIPQEEADENIRTQVRLLESATRYDSDAKADVPAAVVEVVERGDLAGRLERYPRANIVVFPSRGAIDRAKEIALRYRDVKVVVLTGLLPEGEVLFVDKGWDPDAIRDVILGR